MLPLYVYDIGRSARWGIFSHATSIETFQDSFYGTFYGTYTEMCLSLCIGVIMGNVIKGARNCFMIMSPNEVFGDIMVLASPPRPPVDPYDVNALTKNIVNESLSMFIWG